MTGLELSRSFFEEYGKEMIEKDFSEYKDRIAVGLVGHGSECFGFDDEVSIDHDFEPSFCIWLTDEDEKLFGFRLFRAYCKLPKEYMGIKIKERSLGGDNRGVFTINEFYSRYIPNGKVPTTYEEWLSIPDFYLAEGSNGEVFCDPLGEFTKIRNALLAMPEDVRLKKLATEVLNMAQAGQYNYNRCFLHGEKGASGVALTEFVKSAVHAVYLLNDKYMPYYKWMFRGMENLPILGGLQTDLEELLSKPYDLSSNKLLIEKISYDIAEELRRQGLSQRNDDYLEPYAYCIRDKIKDVVLRTSPL